MSAAAEVRPPHEGASRPARRTSVTPSRVAALALFALGLLMLAYGYLYTVPRADPLRECIEAEPGAASARPVHVVPCQSQRAAERETTRPGLGGDEPRPAPSDFTETIETASQAPAASFVRASHAPARPPGILRQQRNRAPTVRLIAASGRVVLAGGCEYAPAPPAACTPTALTVALAARASDPDGDALRYAYSTTGGRVRGDGPRAALDMTGVQPGAYTVTVEVNDARGHTATDSTTVMVERCVCSQPLPRACPTVTVTCPDAASAGEPVTFTANISGGDPNATPGFRWRVGDGRFTHGQGGGSVTVVPSGFLGDLTGVVTVTGYGRRCPASHRCTTRVIGTAATPPPTPTPTPAPTPRPTPTASPRPTPAATPTPAASPTPGTSPTPAPSASPSESPTPEKEDRLAVDRPERFLEGRGDVITCELARVVKSVVDTPTNTNTRLTEFHRLGVTRGPLAEAFPGYTARATFVFESDDLEFAPVGPAEQSLAPESVKWGWRVRLRDGGRETVSFGLRLHVTWVPKDAGGESFTWTDVWTRRFEGIPVGPPPAVRVARQGFYLPLAGGLAFLVVPGLGGQRRRLNEEFVKAEVEGRYREATAGGAPASANTEAEQDEVKFSVFAPPSAAPSDSFLVQVFAHLAAQASELPARAVEADAAAARRGTTALDKPIGRGTELTVCLRMDDLLIDEPSQTITWRGEVEPVLFAVNVPEGRKGGSVVGVVTVLQESVPIGHLKFVFRVAPGGEAAQPTAATTPAPSEFVRYKRAFISYASRDRAEVLKRVQMLDRLKIPYFQDLLDLEPGQRWEPLLYRYIDESDVFYLFWSSAAKRSKWVKKEVQYALKRRAGGHDAPPEIVPVIIEGPPPVAPPPYLSALHFNDKILYFIKGDEGATKG